MAADTSRSRAFLAEHEAKKAQRADLIQKRDAAIENGEPDELERLLEQLAVVSADITREAPMAEAHEKAIKRAGIESERERLAGELTDRAAALGERQTKWADRVRANGAEAAAIEAERDELEREYRGLRNRVDTTARRGECNPIRVPTLDGTTALEPAFVKMVSEVGLWFQKRRHERRPPVKPVS